MLVLRFELGSESPDAGETGQVELHQGSGWTALFELSAQFSDRYIAFRLVPTSYNDIVRALRQKLSGSVFANTRISTRDQCKFARSSHGVMKFRSSRA